MLSSAAPTAYMYRLSLVGSTGGSVGSTRVDVAELLLRRKKICTGTMQGTHAAITHTAIKQLQKGDGFAEIIRQTGQSFQLEGRIQLVLQHVVRDKAAGTILPLDGPLMNTCATTL